MRGTPARLSSNNRKFTGHERASESASTDNPDGLDYMMARYHASSLARFLAVDPMGDTSPEDPQSWNAYSYVRNNPLNHFDPGGTRAFNLSEYIGPQQGQYETEACSMNECSDGQRFASGTRYATVHGYALDPNGTSTEVQCTESTGGEQHLGMGSDLLEFIDWVMTTHEVFSIVGEPPGRQQEFDAQKAFVSIGAGYLASLSGGAIGAEFGIPAGPAGIIVGILVGEYVSFAYDAFSNTYYPISSPVGYGSGPTAVYVSSPFPGGYSGIPFPGN